MPRDAYDFVINVDGEAARDEVDRFRDSLNKIDTKPATQGFGELESSLKSMNSPFRAIGIAMRNLGVANNSLLIEAERVGYSLAALGGRAGLALGGIVLLGIGIEKLVEHIQGIEKANRAFDVLDSKFGLLHSDVDKVATAFEAAGAKVDTSMVEKLIGVGREAGLTTTQIALLGQSAQEAADLAGTSFEHGFTQALKEAKKEAGETLAKFEEFIKKESEGEAKKKEGPLAFNYSKTRDDLTKERDSLRKEIADLERKRFEGQDNDSGISTAGVETQREIDLNKRLVEVFHDLAKAKSDFNAQQTKNAPAEDIKQLSDHLKEEDQLRRKHEEDYNRIVDARNSEQRGIEAAHFAFLESQGLDYQAKVEREELEHAQRIDHINRKAFGDKIALALEDKRHQDEVRDLVYEEEAKARDRINKLDRDEKASRKVYDDAMARGEVELAYNVSEEIATKIVASERETQTQLDAVEAAGASGRITSAKQYEDAVEEVRRQGQERILKIITDGHRKEDAEGKKALADYVKDVSDMGTGLDSFLEKILGTKDAVNDMKLSFKMAGDAGKAEWAALGAGFKEMSDLIQAGAGLVKQALGDALLATQASHEIQIGSIENRILANDSEVQSIQNKLKTATDAGARESALSQLTTKEAQARTKAEQVANETAAAAQAEKTAQVLASLAEEAAMRALFEGAAALASLFVNPAESAAHAAAAAVYAGVAGAAGAGAAAISAGRGTTLSEQQSLEDQQNERDARRQQDASDAAGRRADATSLAANASNPTVHVTFFGSPLVTQAEVGRAVEAALKDWESHK